MHTRFLTVLCLLLIIKAAAIIFIIQHAGIGLGPDEAQYWTWSQFLDWGYYSKPPGIAWQIGLGTYFFGNTELGVRFGALLIGTILPILVYLLARNCRLHPEACFWSAVCIALTPLGFLSSFLAITDGGMILFWALACAYLVDKISKQERPSYALIGLLIGLGALFKWPIYTFWLVALGSWAFFPFLISWRVLAGIVISLIGVLPSLYWNAGHGWPTFKHVLATLAGGHAQPKANAIFKGNIFEFLGSQVGLLSPIVFVMIVLALWKLWRQRERLSGVAFCGGVTTVILVLGMLASIFMKMQGNWIIFAYPTAFIVIGWYSYQSRAKTNWLIAGLAFSVVSMILVFSIPTIQSKGLFSNIPISYKFNPFRHNVGWKNLSDELSKVGYHQTDDFLFGDKYQTTSILSFYGPEQNRAFFFNLQGTRRNQFSFWPSPEGYVGKRGFYVVIENTPHLNNAQAMVDRYLDQLRPYFNEVQFLGIKPLFHAYGKMEKGALIFECRGFNGKMPIEPDLF